MKLRAKIILTAASLALSCALLAGCGSSSGSTASSAASSEPASTVLSQASSIPLGEDNSTDALNAPFETLLDANPISNQFEIAAMTTVLSLKAITAFSTFSWACANSA